MAIARIDNGAIAEQREMSLEEVPPHKRNFWRPIVGDPPEYDARLEVRSGPVLVIEQTRVVRQWTVERAPIDQQRQAVKDEARRRILTYFPEWKQTNMTARGVELQDLWRRNGSWTAYEQAEADALAGVWAWIKAVREASNAIEAMDPIPSDFDADARWPA